MTTQPKPTPTKGALNAAGLILGIAKLDDPRRRDAAVIIDRETAREFAGGLRKSIIRYADETETDIPLRDWMKNRFGDPDCIVVASHVDRDRATVPEGDLVNTQVTLPDGRLARTAHSSQRFVADGSGGHLEMHTIHIFVERPRTAIAKAGAC